MIDREILLASAVVTLGYLGESLYGPLAGTVAERFGASAESGPTFISAAFYGSALAGLVTLLIAPRVRLRRYVAASLAIGALCSVGAVAAPSWEAALAARLGTGLAYGGAVGGIVIGLAKGSRAAHLAQRVSVLFSLVFLAVGASAVLVPYIADAYGILMPALLHGAASIALAIFLFVRTARKPYRGEPVSLDYILHAMPRIFWSPRKTVAFALHLTNLYGALLVTIGLQPALSEHGASPSEIGLALATFSAATCLGGMLHASLARHLGATAARWAITASDFATLGLAVAAAYAELGGPALGAALALALRGLCGGSPSFEALLYDLGPRDAPSAGLQRSLGMIAAISLATLTLSASSRFGLDTFPTVMIALGIAQVVQALAFRFVSSEARAVVEAPA